MITINKNANNNFRVEYINDEGIANGWASTVFNAKELKTQAILKRNIDSFGGTKFDYDSDSVNKDAVAGAIYSSLTSRVIKEFKAEVA